VGLLLQRAGAAAPPATPIDRVRERLADGDEEGSIAAMHALEPDDAARVLQMSDLRARAVKAFNDNEMARAITGLRGGRLLHKLQWLKAEGSSLALVWPLIADTRTPSEERIEPYQHNEMRSFFVDLCNDDEMASVVDLLGGSLEAKLNWMFAEGTSWKAVIQKIQATPDFRERAFLFTKDYMRENFVSLLNNGEMAALVDMLHGTLDQKLGWMAAEGTNGNLVFPKVRAAPDPELRDVKPATRQAVKSELSAKDFRRFEQMLDEGLLFWEEVSKPVTERHYEQKDEKDPTSGYKIKKFEWTSRYEILYMRTALRIRVRICFSGEKATDTHKRMWLSGIHNRWNGKFHLENDRRMALVFEPIFVTSDEHQTVKLHKGPPVARADMTNWTAGPNANGGPLNKDSTSADTAAHEFGHMVGLEDEYQLPESEFKRLLGRDPTPGDLDPAVGYRGGALMGSSAGDVEARYLPPFVDWINAHRLPGEKPFAARPGP
jgi:hypothetical protein